METSSRPFFGTVAVVGTGTMGSGIAQVFASHGSQVHLVGRSDAGVGRALACINEGLTRAVMKGRLEAEEAAAAKNRISIGTDFDVAAGVPLLCETVVEEYEAKSRVLQALNAICGPDTIFATNSSSISITALGTASGRADRLVGMHFMNPVPVMTLVEVVRGLDTSDTVTEVVIDCCRAIGKVPVEVKDSPGFVSNRVMLVLINEACWALMQGVATMEDIDRTMTLGMNHPMGPFALADLIGLDACLNAMSVMHRDIGGSTHFPCPLLVRMVASGRLGKKVGRGFYQYD